MTGKVHDIAEPGPGHLLPDAATCSPTVVDLSLQLAVWADPAKTARRIARLIGGDADALRACLLQPHGILLESLPCDQADDVAARLAGARAVIVTRSDPASARYDVHATRPLDAVAMERLASVRRLIGARPDPLTEAVAADLDRPNRDALLHRLPDLGLVTIDRRFQRFDLLLTGVTGWTTVQLADFLVARTQMPRAAFEQLSPSVPVALDLGLKVDVARQFCADYAALGLLVRPVLSARGRKA